MFLDEKHTHILSEVMSMATDAERRLIDLRHRLKSVENAELVKDEGYRAISAKLDELMSHHVKAR